MYLKERGTLRHMISAGEITQARQFLKESLPELYLKTIAVRALIDALEFIAYIADKELEKAVTFSVENLGQYLQQKRKVGIPTRNREQLPATINIIDLTSLLCYYNPEDSELQFLLTNEQTSLIMDALNNQIISKRDIT